MTDSDAQTPPEPPDGEKHQPPPGYRQSYVPPNSSTTLSTMDDRQWASLAHLGGILGFLPSLIIWLVFKERGPFTNVEAKEALNFQITLAIGYVLIYFVNFVVTVVTFGLISFLGLLFWVLWIAGVVFSIMGFMKAKDGFHYRYPYAIRLIK